VLISILAAASCARADELDLDCAPEAIVEVIQLGSDATQRTCDWGDRRTIISTDARGNVFRRTGMQGGKLDGLQIMEDIRPHTSRRMERAYRRGIRHGPSRTFVNDELVSECFYVDGFRDGVCWWAAFPRSPIAKVERYDRGKRTGFWSMMIGGKLDRTWVYGDDILLGTNGRSVQRPPASIEVDGQMISRCPSSRNLRNPAACHALFEAYQICEVEPPSTDRALCRQLARTTYLIAKRWRWELPD
jgi:hypothetical protein